MVVRDEKNTQSSPLSGRFAPCSFGVRQKYRRELHPTYYRECQQPILEMQSQETPLMGAAKGTIGGGLIGGVSGFFCLACFSVAANVSDAGIGAAVGAASGAISGGISGGFSSEQAMPGKICFLPNIMTRLTATFPALRFARRREQWHCSATRKTSPRLKPGRKPASFRRLRPISAFLIFRAASSRQRQLIGSSR